jgi:hypothetical protein
VQVEEEKDEQLASLSAELLKLHSSLLVERKRILFILQAVPTQLLRVYKSGNNYVRTPGFGFFRTRKFRVILTKKKEQLFRLFI